ncbi:hypothetical protein LCGC14_2637070, partial [marine sediment metagenome]
GLVDEWVAEAENVAAEAVVPEVEAPVEVQTIVPPTVKVLKQEIATVMRGDTR